MSEPATKIKVTKIEVARRQLDAALTLWFSGADPIPIHTLACAAHEVFAHVCKHRGLEPLIFDPKLYVPGKSGKAIYQLEKHCNFFKHADRDPEATTEFPPILSELFMFMSIEGWLSLGGESRELDDAFNLHMMIQCPDAHRTNTQDRLAKSIAVKALAKIAKFQNRQEFLQFFRIGCARKRRAANV